MDTSETYIKMCEKAEEIQDIWRKTPDHCETQDGSFYYPTIADGYEQTVRCVDYEFPYPHKSIFDLIWLPRQDQLQEMAGIYDPNGERGWIDRFLDLLNNKKLVTMEQLWLAFVMKEKYNKVWNGKEWKDV